MRWMTQPLRAAGHLDDLRGGRQMNVAAVIRARKNSPCSQRLVPKKYPARILAGILLPPKSASSSSMPPQGYSPHGFLPGLPQRVMVTERTAPSGPIRSSGRKLRPADGPLGGHGVRAEAIAPGNRGAEEGGGHEHRVERDPARGAAIQIGPGRAHDRDLAEQAPAIRPAVPA